MLQQRLPLLLRSLATLPITSLAALRRQQPLPLR